MDVDEDGIIDVDEVDPVNSETRSVQDFVEKYGDNETMMQSQFNVFIRESVPPIVFNIKIKKHERWERVCLGELCADILTRIWAEIEVEALDVSNFTVTIKINDQGDRSITFEGRGLEWFEAELDLYFGDVVVRYKVTVSMEDFAGNELDPPYEEEIDGFFGGVLRMLEALWDFLVDLACRIADAVAKAVNMLLDLILSLVGLMIQCLMDAIAEATRSFIDGFYTIITTYFKKVNPIETAFSSGAGTAKVLWDFVFIPIAVISAILCLLSAIEALISGMTMGLLTVFGNVISEVITSVLLLIIGMVIMELIIVSAASTVETALGFMGGWSTYFELGASFMVAAAEAFKLFKHGSKALRAAAFSIWALTLALVSASSALSGWSLFVLDIFVLILAFVGLYDMIMHFDEKAWSKLGPIVKTFGWIMVITALVSSSLLVAAHGMAGMYDL